MIKYKSMYYKMVNGVQVFSACKTIQTNEGIWISNPTDEQIADAGWQIYVPPEILPQPETEPDYISIIDAIKKMFSTEIETLSDEQALEVAALYPTWISKVGSEVSLGERLWYNEKLYKVVQAHTVQSDWTPDISTSLFTEVSIEEFPEWVQPTGAQDAYMSGDKVSHNNLHWECTSDYNIYEPGVWGWNQI